MAIATASNPCDILIARSICFPATPCCNALDRIFDYRRDAVRTLLEAEMEAGRVRGGSQCATFTGGAALSRPGLR